MIKWQYIEGNPEKYIGRHNNKDIFEIQVNGMIELHLLDQLDEDGNGKVIYFISIAFAIERAKQKFNSKSE